MMHKMCLDRILCSAFLSPLVHNLNLPLLEVLRLGAGPEKGGEAQQEKVAVSHGNGQKWRPGAIGSPTDENWFLSHSNF